MKEGAVDTIKLEFCKVCRAITEHDIRFTEEEVEYFVCFHCDTVVLPHPLETRREE